MIHEGYNPEIRTSRSVSDNAMSINTTVKICTCPYTFSLPSNYYEGGGATFNIYSLIHEVLPN